MRRSSGGKLVNRTNPPSALLGPDNECMDAMDVLMSSSRDLIAVSSKLDDSRPWMDEVREVERVLIIWSL
jgi:hypothetical protein